MRKISVCLLCFLLLAFFLASLVPIFAQVPTTPKIVFTSWRNDSEAIYTMTPDGNQQVRLTDGFWALNRQPVWSPNGEQILFASNRDGVLDLYLMAPDGKNMRRVFKTVARRQHPTWAPDGKRIAYLDDGEWAIYTADIDGVDVTRIALTGKLGGNPAWSPDGDEIVFVFVEEKNYRLRIINIETGAHRTLRHPAPLVRMTAPAWSPKGDRIAYASLPFFDDEWDQGTIYVVNRDGSDLEQVVAKVGPRAGRPAWSPHGDEILYEQKVDEDKQIFRCHLSQGLTTQLTHKGANFSADWFDPWALPIHPQSQLITATWGKLKQE